MGDELHPMLTRRRSRSKTPFLRSNYDHENCEQNQGTKKISVEPIVQTIREETELVTSSSGSGNKYSAHSLFNKKNKIKSNYMTEIQTSYQPNTTPKKHKFTHISATTSTPKTGHIGIFTESLTTDLFTMSQGANIEISQNELNSAFEASNKQQMEIVDSSSTNILKTKIVLDNLNSNDHLAYLEYKNAGEYWKKTPKTDYTYSKLSPHRRILAPGVVAMPNMSRRSLDIIHDGVNYMRDISNSARNRKFTQKLSYDSTDEYDYTYSYKSKNYQEKQKKSFWFIQWIIIIVRKICNIWTEPIARKENKDIVDSFDSYQLYTKSNIKQTTITGFSSKFISFFYNIYESISNPLIAFIENKGKKRIIIFMLILFPLFLLAGLYYYFNPNEPFLSKAFTDFHFKILSSMRNVEIFELINKDKYEVLKIKAMPYVEYFSNWTSDYLIYIKTISDNVVHETCKTFYKDRYCESI